MPSFHGNLWVCLGRGQGRCAWHKTSKIALEHRVAELARVTRIRGTQETPASLLFLAQVVRHLRSSTASSPEQPEEI